MYIFLAGKNAQNKTFLYVH